MHLVGFYYKNLIYCSFIADIHMHIRNINVAENVLEILRCLAEIKFNISIKTFVPGGGLRCCEIAGCNENNDTEQLNTVRGRLCLNST